MIIRNSNGELIQINKYDFPTDTIYYEKIMHIKKEFTKSNITNISNTNPNKTNNFSKSKDIIFNFINIKTIS
jgi:hypothetical protein